MEKYYTPNLEEFNIGFEYEITNGTEWVKKSFTHEDFNTFLYQHLDNAIKQEYIRVKILDKEDIEDCGLVCKIIDLGQDTSEYYDICSKDGGSLGQWIHDAHRNEANIQMYNSNFRIRNKSEFKQLLKFLNPSCLKNRV